MYLFQRRDVSRLPSTTMHIYLETDAAELVSFVPIIVPLSFVDGRALVHHQFFVRRPRACELVWAHVRPGARARVPIVALLDNEVREGYWSAAV